MPHLPKTALPTPTPGLLVKRPRGRPRGAKTRVLQPDVALGLHHFAFLRSWFQRLDLAQAWQRYMAFSEGSAGARRVERRRAELQRAVLHAGQQLPPGRRDAAQIASAMALVAQAPMAPDVSALPSLDEFIATQGLDREFYTEAELLQEYRDFHHLDSLAEDGPAGPTARQPALAQVRALNLLEGLLARTPAATDQVALWLSPALARLLTAAGIGTLGALADTVRVYGPTWHRRARGLGPARAASLVQWLAPLAASFGHVIPDAALAQAPKPRALRADTLRQLSGGPRFALVPLEALAVPPALAGGRAAAGLSPAPSPPASDHHADDLQAIRQWLALHQGQRATHRAYTKEVERFYLWCLHVQRQPLAATTAADCLAYRAFLAALPADWINPVPTPRADPAWRPFRGALSPASQRYAWGVVQALFDGLVRAGHLAANPARALPKASPATPAATPAAEAARPPTSATRAFTPVEWQFVQGQLADALAVAGTAAAMQLRRLQLVLELLVNTGLRLAELAPLTHDALWQAPDPQSAEDGWWLQVLGPGPQRRQLPLPPAVMGLLARHHADVAQRGTLPRPAPLVCALAEAPRSWTTGADGRPRLTPRATPGAARAAAPGVTLDAAPAVVPLGERGMALMLKRFFRRIARRASAVDGLSAARLQAASAHWLRHTFGHQGAAAGMPLPQLQRALGHAGPTRAGAYLSASPVDRLADEG